MRQESWELTLSAALLTEYSTLGLTFCPPVNEAASVMSLSTLIYHDTYYMEAPTHTHSVFFRAAIPPPPLLFHHMKLPFFLQLKNGNRNFIPVRGA